MAGSPAAATVCVGHLSPEAALGGPLALVRTGDRITIDAQRREITLHVGAGELKRRRKIGPPRNLRAAVRWRSIPKLSAAHLWER